MSTYRELLQTSREILKQQEITDAEVDAWYLLTHVFEIKRTDFLLNADQTVPEDKSRQYLDLVHKRAQHIPLQHITGTQEFMGLEFDVNEDVLIPRQDTEILVEEVLRVCEGRTVLDMCTGSGCIIVSVSKLGKTKKAVGIDISTKALAIARSNAEKHKTEIEFLESNLFEQVKGTYDIIVSNPPYIPSYEIAQLMPEVKNHEPRLALDGDEDGLDFYRRIAIEGKRHLNEKGYLFLEIGYNQGNDVQQILLKEGFADIMIKKDLSGHDRVVSARRS